jgi:hypothetical protein
LTTFAFAVAVTVESGCASTCVLVQTLRKIMTTTAVEMRMRIEIVS